MRSGSRPRADSGSRTLSQGGLELLERLNLGSPQAKPIVDKIRSAGVDCFRYMLDHPLVMYGEIGLETGASATRIAALVQKKSPSVSHFA